MIKNQVIFTGNVCRAFEVKYLQNGLQICEITIAVNDEKDKPLFLGVVVFGDACNNLTGIAKGSLITVGGKLQVDEYVNKQGVKQTRNKVIAEIIMRQYLRKRDEQGQPPQQPPASEQYAPPVAGEVVDDDIPF